MVFVRRHFPKTSAQVEATAYHIAGLHKLRRCKMLMQYDVLRDWLRTTIAGLFLSLVKIMAAKEIRSFNTFHINDESRPEDEL